MKLRDVIARKAPQPGAERGKIPWDDPAFSARMLAEHLSSEHDQASRRHERIQRHASWIHEDIMKSTPGRILDLGCGPGLYTAALAELGHQCVGVDFSPASIAHARSEAERRGLDCEYQQGDLRDGGFGQGFQLAFQIFGELNTFRRPDVAAILAEVHRAVAPDGLLVLEVQSETAVRELGQRSRSWFTADRGLFSPRPHICLQEFSWLEAERATIERHFVIDAASSEVAMYENTLWAYSVADYDSLLRDAGFATVARHSSLTGSNEAEFDGYSVLVARSSNTG